jgi:hypothetical protein
MYGSFHVKWMSLLSEFSQNSNMTKTFVTISNIKFHVYLSGGSQLVPNVQRVRHMDRQTIVQTSLMKVVDLLTYLLTYLHTYLLNGAESFLTN